MKEESLVTDPIAFGDALVREIGLVPHTFNLRLAIWVAIVLATAMLARAGVSALVRVVWRLGLDRARRLGRLASVVRAGLWFVGGVAMLRPVFAGVPVLTTTASMLAALLTAIALPGLVQSAAAGLSLALRGRYREGDQIEVEGYRGSIRYLGLVRTQLRVDDGSMVWLPNAMLDKQAVRTDRSTGAAPVRIRFEIRTENRDAVLDALTRAAMLLPFRRSGSTPRLQPVSEDERQWSLELQTWATRELELVRRSLRRTVDGVLATHGGQR